MDNFIFLPARSRKNAGNSATGKLSVALGQHCTASGEYSLADGSGCIASTACSVALGNAADASNTCGFMYRDMCGNTFCFDSGGQGDNSGQLLINGKPIGGTQEATYGKFLVTYDHVYPLHPYKPAEAISENDGTARSLQDLFAYVGVTTPPKWIKMTFIGAGGGGGLGFFGTTGDLTGAGSGGGPGGVYIVAISGEAPDGSKADVWITHNWENRQYLMVGRGGWYSPSLHNQKVGSGYNLDVYPSDPNVRDHPRDAACLNCPGWDWDFLWEVSGGNGVLPWYPTDKPWTWSGKGGDCVWGLLNPTNAPLYAGAYGGGSGRGPIWWTSSSWPDQVPQPGFYAGAVLTGGWPGDAGNDASPWADPNGQYTGHQGTSVNNNGVTGGIPGAGGSVHKPLINNSPLSQPALEVWGVGGRAPRTGLNPDAGRSNTQYGIKGVPGIGYGAGGSGDGGSAGTNGMSSEYDLDDWLGYVTIGGPGGDAALIIEWGSSPS